MTFYQELQLNQAGSKNLLKKSETVKEKSYHILVYLVKIAVTMVFCFLFVTIFSILFGNENSIVGVVVLLCLMVFRNADLGIHTGQSTMLLALFFVIMTVCPHLANQFSPVLGTANTALAVSCEPTATTLIHPKPVSSAISCFNLPRTVPGKTISPKS